MTFAETLCAFQAATALFGGTRTESAVKGQYERARQMYSWIKEYNRFTGNGGGDGDEVASSNDDDGDDGEVLRISMSSRKIVAARKAGKSLGSLTAKVVIEWEDQGWFDLFDGK